MKTMLLMACLSAILLLSALPAMADDTMPLKLTQSNIHDATLSVLEDGVYEIHTTGDDPYVFTEPLKASVDPEKHRMLAFEYFSTTGTNHVQIFVIPPLDEKHSVMSGGLNISEVWSAHAIDLKSQLGQDREPVRQLRLDFGSQPGKVIRMRGLLLRPQNERERRLETGITVRRAAEKRLDGRVRDYLKQDFPCRVTQVTANAAQITVSGQVGRVKGALFLAEVPLYADITELKAFPFITPLHCDARRRFMLTLERRRTARSYDRLLSRWAVVRRMGAGYALLSHARYVDAIRPQWNLPDERPRNKKGLGGFNLGYPTSDLDDLGIAAVTVNIVLNGLIYTESAPGRAPFTYAGKTWYSDDHGVSQLDDALRAAAGRHIVVSAIILLGQPGNAGPRDYSRLIAYPNANPSGIFVMPDVASEQGVTAYAAGLDFLARRYSRPDNRYGRIHHWIMHNEVNAGWIWTNAGEKTARLYMDLYQRSMRVAYLIARQYNAHSRVFISLEHHWTDVPTPQFYAGRDLLELLADYSRAEGDFDWSVAFHPYPQNLFEPRVWEDTEVNFTYDTPKITFKNLEVLNAWLKRPAMRYLGKYLRKAHLTEQGLNSRDYSETALRDQAAGMAYAWNKFKGLDGIEVFDYHNWVDNRGEGGLRIGLRRFPDDKDDPLGKKPIWRVYEALGTPNEDAETAFALPVIGIRDWSEIRHAEPEQPGQAPAGLSP
jgi:hypothetical protein